MRFKIVALTSDKYLFLNYMDGLYGVNGCKSLSLEPKDYAAVNRGLREVLGSLGDGDDDLLVGIIAGFMGIESRLLPKNDRAMMFILRNTFTQYLMRRGPVFQDFIAVEALRAMDVGVGTYKTNDCFSAHDIHVSESTQVESERVYSFVEQVLYQHSDVCNVMSGVAIGHTVQDRLPVVAKLSDLSRKSGDPSYTEVVARFAENELEIYRMLEGSGLTMDLYGFCRTVCYRGSEPYPETRLIMEEAEGVVFDSERICDGFGYVSQLVRLNDEFPGVVSELYLDYIAQAFKCVRGIHARGVSHQDVCDAQFLLNSVGRLKIADFGTSSTVSQRHDVQGRLEFASLDKYQGFRSLHPTEGTTQFWTENGYVDVIPVTLKVPNAYNAEADDNFALSVMMFNLFMGEDLLTGEDILVNSFGDPNFYVHTRLSEQCDSFCARYPSLEPLFLYLNCGGGDESDVSCFSDSLILSDEDRKERLSRIGFDMSDS